MSREKRIELIEEIEKARNSKVITYITSDRQNLSVQIASDIIPIIHNHILSFSEKEREKLIFLFTDEVAIVMYLGH